MERYASQPAITAAAVDVNSGAIPSQFQLDGAAIEIDPIDAAVAFSQVRTANFRGGEQRW